MTVKQSVRFLLLALACFSLAAAAQDNSETNITGSGTKGKIPVFTGSHSVENSIVTQSSGNIHVAGGITANRAGSSAQNVVSGTNRQATRWQQVLVSWANSRLTAKALRDRIPIRRRRHLG